MTPLILLPAMAASFAIGIALQQRLGQKRERAFQKRWRSKSHLQELIASRMLLTAIREDRIADALEVLEVSVDTNVFVLWNNFEQVDAFTKDLYLDTLRRVKSYREKWPRTIDVALLSTNDIEIEPLQQSANEAREILARV